jgi:hypothetical protein
MVNLILDSFRSGKNGKFAAEEIQSSEKADKVFERQTD